jgi:hypothetical protein
LAAIWQKRHPVVDNFVERRPAPRRAARKIKGLLTPSENVAGKETIENQPLTRATGFVAPKRSADVPPAGFCA